MSYFNCNGKLYESGSPVINPDSRGLRYGDGLFETMKMKDGRIIFEDEHFARLWKGLRVLEFEIPKLFTIEKLQQEIGALAKKNQHEKAARVRLTIVRSDGGLFDIKSHVPLYIIQTWPLAEAKEQWNSNGLVLGVHGAARKAIDILSNLKHNNYLPYVLAALQAKREKWNDAVLLNTNGNLCDTTIANIFLIKDEVIYTPSLAEGCVAGVLRKMIIKNLQHTGRAIVETALSTDQLLSADELFVSNSMYTMRWVQRIADTSYSNAITQEIFANFIQTIS